MRLQKLLMGSLWLVQSQPLHGGGIQKWLILTTSASRRTPGTLSTP